MVPRGFEVFPIRLSEGEQRALVGQIMDAAAASPFYRPVTPWGKPMSVEMTNLGPLGWISGPTGYEYVATHPITGSHWPPMPAALLELWSGLIDPRTAPDACLVNLYRPGARMGLHQDRDEVDFSIGVLSVSLGDTAVFRIGGEKRSSPSRSISLASGAVCVLAGEARLAFHGVDRIIAGTSDLIPGGGRLNLTLRRATLSEASETGSAKC